MTNKSSTHYTMINRKQKAWQIFTLGNKWSS